MLVLMFMAVLVYNITMAFAYCDVPVDTDDACRNGSGITPSLPHLNDGSGIPTPLPIQRVQSPAKLDVFKSGGEGAHAVSLVRTAPVDHGRWRPDRVDPGLDNAKSWSQYRNRIRRGGCRRHLLRQTYELSWLLSFV